MVCMYSVLYCACGVCCVCAPHVLVCVLCCVLIIMCVLCVCTYCVVCTVLFTVYVCCLLCSVHYMWRVFHVTCALSRFTVPNSCAAILTPIEDLMVDPH